MPPSRTWWPGRGPPTSGRTPPACRMPRASTSSSTRSRPTRRGATPTCRPGARTARPPCALRPPSTSTTSSRFTAPKQISSRSAFGRLSCAPCHSPTGARPGVVDAVTSIPELEDSDLAEQVERSVSRRCGLSLEDLSRLWSVFFQVPYKLSLAYQASVVLIDAEVPPQPALPVRASNLYVMPLPPAGGRRRWSRTPAQVCRSCRRTRSSCAGATCAARRTRVRIGGAEVVPDASQVRDDRDRVVLPAGLPAGVLGGPGDPPPVGWGRRRPSTPARTPNLAPFVLRPKIEGTGPGDGPDFDVSISAPVDGVRTVTVGTEPW